MFSEAIVIDKENLTKNLDLSPYNLLVLSGGSGAPTVLRHPEKYVVEIDLIKESKIPVLGICLGAEIICEAYGGVLKELPEKQRGVVKLKIGDRKLQDLLNSNRIEVVEGHKIGIQTLPKDFVSCAFSEHGVEIFRHLNKPIIGFQFHPEVSNDKKLLDWAFEILNLS